MLTVFLPLWRAKDVAWFSLEGLCCQREAPEWELIVAEESEHSFGRDRVDSYSQRLLDAGCVSVRYIDILQHIPITTKYAIMANKIHPESEVVCFHGADDYSSPYRLRDTPEVMSSCDWATQKSGMFYDIPSGRKMLYRRGNDDRMGLSVSIRASLFRQIEVPGHRRLAETRIHSKALQVNPDLRYGSIPGVGVYTDGMNTITHRRRRLYLNPQKPFYKTNLDVRKFMSDAAYSRLLSLKRGGQGGGES